MPNWLEEKIANRYIKTYFKGFVDISGGNLYLRNGNLDMKEDENNTIFTPKFTIYQNNINSDSSIINISPN